MQKRILVTAVIAIFSISFFNWGCSKLDTTDIGSDLLPPVDNVKTFDTLLPIITTQALFNDTTVVSRFSDHILGFISNDPLFGRTNADIYLQLKPGFYPYYYGNAGDTTNIPGTGLDSIVLCLNYKGFWGDSSMPIGLEVREVFDPKFRDSVYDNKTINYSPTSTGGVIGSASVNVLTIGKYIKFNNRRDSVKNQIRIKLNPAWATQFFNRDSTRANLSNNAYYSDSAFRKLYNGLAIKTTGTGNGLIYVNLADTATKLEVHFKRRNNGPIDSAYVSLRLNTIGFPSSTAPPPSNTVNHIVRNRSGAPMLSPTSNELYIQATPGTYINLKIPDLSTLSNRVIHRAEIIIEQIPTNPVYDKMFTAPNFLYLDLKDTGTANRWKPVYFDMSPTQSYDPDYRSGLPYFPTNGVDFFYFGGFRRDKTDLFGNPINFYFDNRNCNHGRMIIKRRKPTAHLLKFFNTMQWSVFSTV